MKITKVAIVISLLAAFSAVTAWAEELQQPASTMQASIVDNNGTFSNVNFTGKDDADEPMAACYPEPSCCESSCKCCKPCCGIEISGWISSGISGNAYGAPNNGPLGFNDVGDGGGVIPGNYYELTCGLNYSPNDRLSIRPELRYDWFEGSTASGSPFDNNTKTAQVSGGFDFIVRFYRAWKLADGTERRPLQ